MLHQKKQFPSYFSLKEVDWCQKNNAMISDEHIQKNDAGIAVGGYYEIVERPVKTRTYKEKRLLAYPSIEEQLDMLYWDQVNGTTVWKEAIQAIKERYPKV